MNGVMVRPMIKRGRLTFYHPSYGFRSAPALPKRAAHSHAGDKYGLRRDAFKRDTTSAIHFYANETQKTVHKRRRSKCCIR